MEDLRNKFNVEAPRCRGAYLEDAPPHIWGHPDWVLEPKEDGWRLTLQIGDERSLLVGRNRQDFLKGVARAKEFRHLPGANPFLEAMKSSFFSGTVLDGELTECFDSKGNHTEDTKRRIANGEWVGFIVWQAMYVRGTDIRHWADWQRRHAAEKCIELMQSQGVPGADRIRLIDRFPATHLTLNQFLDAGMEGVVVKDKTKPIPVGQRTNSFWFKVKGSKFRTVDAYVVGVTEGKGGGSGLTDTKRTPNGTAASFTMAMKGHSGNNVEVCKLKNLPDDVHARGFQHFSEYQNKVIEMQISGWDGKRLRWPKFVKFRDDKSPSDCLFHEQIGGKK